jgi:hypothetical protein
LRESWHGHAARRSALPRERVSPLALFRRDRLVGECLLLHTFCVMARTLLTVENSFCIMCNFKELRVAKITHISTSALCA